MFLEWVYSGRWGVRINSRRRFFIGDSMKNRCKKCNLDIKDQHLTAYFYCDHEFDAVLMPVISKWDYELITNILCAAAGAIANCVFMYHFDYSVIEGLIQSFSIGILLGRFFK